jgi:hypothetical protein
MLLSNAQRNYADAVKKSDEDIYSKNPMISLLVVILAVLLLAFEISIFIYALIIAGKCYKKDVPLHFIIALMFPLPYVIVASASNKCAYSYMKGTWIGHIVM